VFITLSNMGSSKRDSSAGGQGSPGRGVPGDVQTEALEAVQDALQWQLAESRWQAIEEILTTMETAFINGDREALEAATVHLEMAGPLRITRIGATPIVPPPPPILLQLNHLVLSLGGATPAPSRLAGEPGTGNDVPRRS
jgi:hypothetical protein